MRRAAPGDIVVSYADGRVGKIGVMTDFAIGAPKPDEFGTVGLYWNASGWLLPVQWLDVSLSFRPKEVLDRLGPLLPRTHSPINAGTGNGNQKAYLAEVDQAVVDLVLKTVGLPESYVLPVPDGPSPDFAGKLEDIVEVNIRNDMSLDQTVREQLVRARRGQGIFRKRVIEAEPVCRITGIDRPTLLIASHIKPWRACGTADERLDGANGLMMAPHADFLFDRGLLGFDEDGRTMFSSQLTDDDAEKLGMHVAERPPTRPLRDHSQVYFAHHRANVFIL
ncbi:MAG: HNH endonuclease [Beijerinckiaceae bacterium]|nr:HNH endonuclease [Beijerinckiaceae bacterium]